MKTQDLLKPLTVAVLALAAGAALADRPLTVDNAAINARNSGDAELWVTDVDGSNLVSLRGNYSFWDSVELGALIDDGSGLTRTGLQGKWLITPVAQGGCNFAAALGWSRVKLDGFGSNNATELNGIMSCHGIGPVNLHFNLGTVKPSGGSATTTWGLAGELPLGRVTPHAEVFGFEDGDETVQLGLRGDIAKNIQLDGTIGRTSGVNLYSVGLRFKF
jgi:hypothetical protein